MKPNNIFPVVNLKSPLFIFQALTFTIVPIMMTTALVYADTIFIGVVLVIIILVGPLIIVHRVFSRLIIHQEYITIGSFFYKRKIKLEDMQTVKIYTQKGKYTGDFINENQANSFDLISVSLKNNRKKELVLPYNQEVYRALKQFVN